MSGEDVQRFITTLPNENSTCIRIMFCINLINMQGLFVPIKFGLDYNEDLRGVSGEDLG